jgi:predicted alpha-1,2-mannosidase
MELAPTMHGAVFRVTFGEAVGAGEPKRVCFREGSFHTEGDAVVGVTMRVGQGSFIRTKDFQLHIRAEATVTSEGGGTVKAENMGSSLACLSFTTPTQVKGGAVMEVRIATSMISKAQVSTTLHRELPAGDDFDAIAARAKHTWNELLGRVDVRDPGPRSESADRHLRIFYTGLARALTFPRRLDEVDASGRVVHYSPYSPSGGVHPGPLVTDNGFWDTYRTVYPLLSLAYPDHLGNIVQGWLNAYKEGGWLPSWASPGYRNCMVGTFADVVIADAIVKRVPGIDLVLAAQALIKDSYTEPPMHAAGAVGKEGLGSYHALKYVAATPQGHDAVSRTLDYAFSDFSVSKAFSFLSADPEFSAANRRMAMDLSGKAKELMDRSLRAHDALYDSSKGLMVPKDARGGTRPGFDPLAWGLGYTEGNAYQHSFPAFALDRLARLHGGKEKLAHNILRMVHGPSNFRPGSYGQEIHEMTEARAFSMGQYAHNNQPVHHILYMLGQLDHADEGAIHLRRVMEKGYGIDFYAGDEDNGEQGAWFALSAMGLFGLVLGTPEYATGSPVFPHVTIARPAVGSAPVAAPMYTADLREIHTGLPRTGAGVEPLHIIATGTSPAHVTVDAILVNNHVVAGKSVSDVDLQKGGTVLRFVMEGEGWDVGSESNFHTSAKELNARAATGGMVFTSAQAPPLLAPPAPGAGVGGDKEEVERVTKEFQQREAALLLESQHQRGMAESLQHRLDVLEQKLRVHPEAVHLVTATGAGGAPHTGRGAGSASRPILGLDPTSTRMLVLDAMVLLAILLLMVWGCALGAGWDLRQGLRWGGNKTGAHIV